MNNDEPLFDSDVDPKRIKSVADGLRRQGEFESARMLDGYADLLEAREKAVPIYQLMATDDSWWDVSRELYEAEESHAGRTRILYTHPAPSDAERLAEALRELKSIANALPALATKTDVIVRLERAERMAATINKIIQAHAAEAAQAQPQAAEPVYQVDLGDGYNDVDEALFQEYERFNKNHPNYYDIRILYASPQPAKDASKYQELLMAVEKKFPGESRHETALRYIRETELQSCEPKCDAAMAKESGR